LLKELPNLEELRLDSADITDKGAAMLASVRTLKSLDLYHTRVSAGGYKQIKGALPECNIFWQEESGSAARRN
jgi:hypothetical protein